MKKYLTYHLPAGIITAALWFLVFRFDYDRELGVFESGVFGKITVGVTLVLSLLCFLPMLTAKKGIRSIAEPAYLEKSGAAAVFTAVLSAVFVIYNGFVIVKDGLGSGILQKISTVLVVVSAVVTAAYFVITALSGSVSPKKYTVLFPSIWAFAQILYWYFSTVRAINDPKLTLLEFVSAFVMLEALYEAKTMLSEAEKPAFASATSLSFISAGISLAMLADVVIGKDPRCAEEMPFLLASLSLSLYYITRYYAFLRPARADKPTDGADDKIS